MSIKRSNLVIKFLAIAIMMAVLLFISSCKEAPAPSVESITVSAAGNVASISTYHGTLQMSAVVLPEDADDLSVVWSVQNSSGTASISSTGLLSAITNGSVTVKATSVSNPEIMGTKVITLTNQDVSVSSVVVSATGGVVTIVENQGTLQMNVSVLPADAADDSIVWTVLNGTGSATISSSGLLTAVSDGTVTARATSVSNNLIYGSLVITISNQDVLVSSIVISSAGSVEEISVFHGTLQMSAVLLPENATSKTFTWRVINGTGSASISSTGLLTAEADGTVTVRATVMSQEDVYDEMIITLSNQEVLVESIELSSAGNSLVIDTFGGTLQMNALVLPADASDKSVIWSVTNGTGTASISSSGLLTALSNGTVTVVVTSVGDSEISDSMLITLSHQEVVVSSVSVASALDASVIITDQGTLQMSAIVLPANAVNKLVTWSVINGTGSASISELGLLTAITNGTVTVQATAQANGEIYGTKIITISNQIIPVTSIEVSSEGDVMFLEVFHGTLQMSALVLPVDASDDSVIWSIVNGTGSASIDNLGLLTAISDGTVTVVATSGSNGSIFGSKVITLSNQVEILVPEAIVELGLAGDFVVLAKAGISTATSSLITGNIGVSPAAATYITGFSLTSDGSTTYATSAQVVGMVYAADFAEPTPTYLTTAISNMETAYTDAASRAPHYTELFAGDLSGHTLVGGVYKWGTDVLINTNITLTGSATDVWIFQISGSLVQAAGAQIILSGGALAENIFWQVAGDVLIGANAHFEGTILCMTNVALETSATLNGKIFAQTAVTLDANHIN